MKIVRRRDLRPIPWKNQLGVTSDITLQPDGTSREDFIWRISLAEGGDCAPYSAYTGVDRTMLLMEGPRIMLDFGAGTVMLGWDTAPLSYPGEAPVTGWPDAGPAAALNVMTRRDHASHRVTVAAVDGRAALPDRCRAVVCRSGAVTIGTETLHHCDTALLPEDAPLPAIGGSGEIVAVCVELMDAGARSGDDAVTASSVVDIRPSRP